MLQANVIDLFHGDNREAIPDFVALKNAGIIAVPLKASQGSNYFDPQFSARRDAAIAAGLLVGAYHFLDASDAKAQAAHFQAALNAVPMKVAAPIMLAADFEKSNSTPTLQQLQTFMTAVELANPGTSVVVYSSDLIRECLKPQSGGHQTPAMINCEQYFAQHRLWLAEYGPHENPPWPWTDAKVNPKPLGVWLWQFSETGREPPIVGNVDLNYYAGGSAQLAANWVN